MRRLKKPPRRPVPLGTFQMGYEHVHVTADPAAQGGSFCLPDATMTIGIDHTRWSDVLSTLVHEAFELSLCRQGRRYESTRKTSGDHGDYLFQMDHSEMSQACQEVADLIEDVYEPLRRTWRTHKKS